MKTQLFTLASLVLAIGLKAQTPVTVSTQATYTDQVWYSLINGEVQRRPLAEWDLAFEVTGLTAGVRVNTAKGTVVYETPFTFDHLGNSQWDELNTADPDNWTRIDNAVDEWGIGALNHGHDMDQPGGINLGWGVYMMNNHHMYGTKLYALKMPDQSWLKLRINSIIGGVFSFTYAALDGTNEHEGFLNKSQFVGKNFAYWSFAENASQDREPPSAQWDLLFTKYIGFVPTPYNVTGVLQNRNVTALQVDDTPTSEADWAGEAFSSDIDVIGSDWKTYDMDAGQFVAAEDRAYFLKDRAGNIHKVVFTGFGGSANGEYHFNQEMVSSVGVKENALLPTGISAYPNPARRGLVRIGLGEFTGPAQLQAFDLTGKTLYVAGLNGNGTFLEHQLETAEWAPGVYVLQMHTQTGFASTKLVVE